MNRLSPGFRLHSENITTHFFPWHLSVFPWLDSFHCFKTSFPCAWYIRCKRVSIETQQFENIRSQRSSSFRSFGAPDLNHICDSFRLYINAYVPRYWISTKPYNSFPEIAAGWWCAKPDGSVGSGRHFNIAKPALSLVMSRSNDSHLPHLHRSSKPRCA